VAVAFDAKGTVHVVSPGTTLTDTSLTISAGLTNSALIVMASYLVTPAGTLASSSVTWDGTNLTKIAEYYVSTGDGNTGLEQIWGLANPASGNQNLVFNWSPSAYLTGECASSWQGVNQSNPFINVNQATANSTTASVTITSSPGDFVIAIHANETSGDAGPIGVNGTELFHEYSAVRQNAGNYAAQSTTTTLTWSVTNSRIWMSLGCDISGASSATTSLFRQPNLDGLSTAGPFFSNPLNRVMLGWRKGLVFPRRAFA